MDLIFGDTAAPHGSAAAQDLIKESNTQSFMQDVIDVSMSVPVAVIFWSPRSLPSKQSVSILERLVQAASGRVRMVKINIDENRPLAQQMQVQAIPTLFAIKDGRPLDMLAGPQGEHQLKAFMDAIGGGNGQLEAQINAVLDAARQALADGQLPQAIAMYQQVLQAAPGNPSAIAGFLRCNMAAGRLEKARELLTQIPDDLKKHPEIMAVIAALDLAAEGEGADSQALLARLSTNPDDHQARFDLAMAAYAADDATAAIRELLEIVRRDRTWNEDGARLRLLKILEALGPTDPIAKSGRRQLQMILMV
ncbi:MAG: tetratricopeptide repeat protein [Rhodospirillaceae bacterium]|nr:tetratricopeptide repeat protein [Rhodospirillaceae bacterium]